MLKVFQKSYNEKVVVRTNDFSPGNNNQLPVQDYDFSQQTWGAKKQILFNKGNYCLFQANPTSLSLFSLSCFLGKKFTSPRSKFLRLDVYTTSFKTEIFFSKRFSLRFQGFEICFLRCTHLTRLNKMMLNWAANLKWFQNCYAKVQGNVSRNNWKIFQGLCLLRWKSFYI